MSSELLRRVVWYKFTDISEVLASFIIRAMMEAASTSETSVNFYQTARRKNPVNSHLPNHVIVLISMSPDHTLFLNVFAYILCKL
jgi:hypothetical protein